MTTAAVLVAMVEVVAAAAAGSSWQSSRPSGLEIGKKRKIKGKRKQKKGGKFTIALSELAGLSRSRD